MEAESAEAEAPVLSDSGSAAIPTYDEPPPQYEPESPVPLDTGYLSPGAPRQGRRQQFNRRQPAFSVPAPNSRLGSQFGTPF